MRKIAYFVAMFLVGVIALAIALNLHEIGHTLIARLAGDRDAMYFLYRHDPSGGTCIGCNVYDDQRLSYVGNIAVTVAGLAATQSVALSLLLWGGCKRLHSLKRQVILLVAFVFMVDAPGQVFQALQANIANQQHLIRVDLADTLYLIMQRSSLPSTILKTMLACCLTLYALLVAGVYTLSRQNAKPTQSSTP